MEQKLNKAGAIFLAVFGLTLIVLGIVDSTPASTGVPFEILLPAFGVFFLLLSRVAFVMSVGKKDPETTDDSSN